MENLKQFVFSAKDWTNNNNEVKGKLVVRDRQTLEPFDGRSNPNGFILCLENDEGLHIVNPETVSIYSKVQDLSVCESCGVEFVFNEQSGNDEYDNDFCPSCFGELSEIMKGAG